MKYHALFVIFKKQQNLKLSGYGLIKIRQCDECKGHDLFPFELCHKLVCFFLLLENLTHKVPPTIYSRRLFQILLLFQK